MAIFMILFVVVAAVLLTAGALFISSFLFGGLLLCTKRTRILVPIFFLIVPATILGSLAGGVILGYLAVRANENLVFLGPLGGFILGGIIGFFIGLAGAGIWWWRISAKRPDTD